MNSSSENFDEPSGKVFRYQIAFRPKISGMLLWVYEGDAPKIRFEDYGLHSLGLHKPSFHQGELDPEHRRFIQNLLRFANLNSSDYCFVVPKKQVAFFLSKLVRFRDVTSYDDDKPVLLAERALNVQMVLEEQSARQLRLRANFQIEETGEKLDFQEALVFVGRRSWVVQGHEVYAVQSSPLANFLEDFSPQGELVLQGDEAADFIQDYLPLLVRKPQVSLPADFKMPEVLQVAGQAVYEVSEDASGEKLLLEIRFSYDGHLVVPHHHSQDVLVEVELGERKLLVRRDIDYEQQVLQEFVSQGFRRVSDTRFETGGEQALDFVAENLSDLEASGNLKNAGSLRQFKMFGELGEAQLKAQTLGSGMDWFEVKLGFEVDGVDIPYEVIQRLMAQGQRFLKVPDKGFLKINHEDFASFEEKLSEIDAEVTEKGHLKISKFHAAYFNEILAVDWTAAEAVQSMIQGLRHVEAVPHLPLPKDIRAVLREYQQHGFDWLSFLHEYRFHGILADDMGLGKTLQALTYLLSRHEKEGPGVPSLVVAPTSVVFNWTNEAAKFTPQLKILVLAGPDRRKLYAQIAEHDLVITSYAVFRRDIETLSQYHWRTVVLDEAQNIKNYRSKTAQLVKQLTAEQRWALTGTPLENRLSELWSIFDFLMPGFLGRYAHFKQKYQQPIELHQSEEHLQRLRRRIYPFVLRRLKDEVASELPPKTEVTQYCEMTHEQQKLYQEVLAGCRRQVFSDIERQGIERSQVSILTALLRLRQVCCHPQLLGPEFAKKEMLSGKMEAFKELILEVIEEGHRLLVFSQFVEMLSLIRTWFEERGIAYEYLDGRTRKREERVKRFNESEDIPVFLVSLRAGGTGLNLTGASYVIHYDPWWNPAVQDQATDRVHRIGQKKRVFAYRMITKDSVEEKILALQERKRGLVKGLLSTDSALGKKLSYEDLEYLFSV